MRAMARLSPADRRDMIVDAALAVALRNGLASTTVRDVAAEMGTSSGLIHHYFDSMDDVLAAAFDRAASADLERSAERIAAAPDPSAALAGFFATYAPVEADWAFQLWLDAWAEAARRPALRATSRRLNLAWQRLLATTIQAGVADRSFRCADPAGAAWRILSLLDGLALQVVAHRTTLRRADVLVWASAFAEAELDLPPGALAAASRRAPRPDQGRRSEPGAMAQRPASTELSRPATEPTSDRRSRQPDRPFLPRSSRPAAQATAVRKLRDPSSSVDSPRE